MCSDKTILVWTLTRGENTEYGYAAKSLRGHSHFVQDVALSNNGKFALSGSWDGTLRLWNLATGQTTFRYLGHSKDVLSVTLSPDNRQIVSGSRDRTMKLWNTIGDCMYTFGEPDGHTEWVSCVRFSPAGEAPTVVSGSWDRTVKVWNVLECKIIASLAGHTGYVSSVTVSPDGSLCASGGKDGQAILWDLSKPRLLYKLDAGGVINSLVFSPNRYWLCAATEQGIKIWDLEYKSVVDDLRPELPERSAKAQVPYPISLAWSADGTTLYSGYTDGIIRVWTIGRRA